jgi:hypothetical protein
LKEIMQEQRMTERESWDWDTKEKCITDVNEWRKKFPIVREFVVSDDGEKISAIVEIENKRVTPA